MPRSKKRTIRANRERRKASSSLHPTFESLQKIFQYLDKSTLLRCAQVCKLWRTAAYSPHFWTRQLFCTKFDRLDNKTALSLKEREISTICLELSKVTADYTEDHTTTQSDILKCVGIADARTLVLKAPTNPPRRYYLYGYTDRSKKQPYKPEDFRGVVACPQITASYGDLKCLVIAGRIKIYRHGFMQSLQVLKNLTHLWITHTTDKHDFRIKTIFTELPSLKDLEISLSVYLAWTVGRSDFEVLPNSERLMLHNTEPWYFDGSGRGRQVRDQEFTSRFLWDIHDKFPMLRHLGVHIDEYKRIIEEKRGSLPSLSNLCSFQNTDSCHGGFLPNQSILVQLLPSKLAALDLTFTTNTWGEKAVKQSFSEEALELITTRFPGLKVLKLKGYNPISEVTLIDILSKMDKLEILSMNMGSPHVNSLRERERNRLPDPYNSLIVSLLIDYVNPSSEDNSTKSFHIIDLDKLRALRYLRLYNKQGVIEKRIQQTDSRGFEWEKVRHGSDDWKEATGYGYFHPDDSFCLESHNKSALGNAHDLIQLGLE